MTPRESQAQGRNFEELLEYQHGLYRNRGRAAIYHNKTAGRFVAQGVFVAYPGGSRPDFSGTIAPGLSVHFDAKTMSRGDVRGWRLTRDRIHQYEDLLDQARMGALAFFLVECRPMRAIFLLRVHPDIPVVDNRPECIFEEVPTLDCIRQSHAGRPGYMTTETAAFCVAQDQDGLYDWLSAVERVWIDRGGEKPKIVPGGLVQRKKGGPTGPRGTDADVVVRNQAMIAEYLTGKVLQEALAEKHHLSVETVHDILRRDPRIKFKRGRPGPKPGTSRPGGKKERKSLYLQRLKSIEGVHQGRFSGKFKIQTVGSEET